MSQGPRDWTVRTGGIGLSQFNGCWIHEPGCGRKDNMSSFSAKPTHQPKRVVIVVYDGVTLLDATGPAEVFGTAANADAGGPPAYEVVLASAHGGMVRTDGGIDLGTHPLEEVSEQPIDTLLVAGGNGVFHAGFPVCARARPNLADEVMG